MSSVTKQSAVALREITSDTVREICGLSVGQSQRKFVAHNALSIAEARYSEFAWERAVYADESAVGFLMLHDDPAKPEYYLWRFMIDQRYQRLGFGRRAMEILIEHVKKRPGATELLTSCVQDDGGPQPFYESLGFVFTGAFDDGEAVLRLRL